MDKIILFIAAFLLGYFNLSIPMYISFLLSILWFLFSKKVEKKELFNHILVLALVFALFLPDNYLVIGIIYLIAMYLILKNHQQIKEDILKNKCKILFAGLFLIISTVINGLSIVKLLFSFMYLVPTFLVVFNFKHLKLNREYVKSWLYPLIFSQYIAVFSYWLANRQALKLAIDFDWVTGTLGLSQCNILCLICLVSAVFLLDEFIKKKNILDILFSILAIVLAVCTSSIAILLLFIGIMVVVLFFNKTDLKKKVLSAAVIAILISVFSFVTPQWMKNDIANFTNSSYVEQRVGKIKNYRQTFIELPQKYPVQSIVGTGVGNYSSRTALTCTGKYVAVYNKLFQPEISKYTKLYIMRDYEKVITYKLSTLSTPYSSIISIQGEFGFIGTILFLTWIIVVLKNSNSMQKGLILFFVSILFLENYIEFAKVVSIFAMCYVLLDLKQHKLD